MTEDNKMIDLMAHMIACEKMVNMISTIEQTFEFIDEYQIRADIEVKKALLPLIEKMNKWVK